ncbi:hypothetical protein PG988_014158 [Apiospora saccharicola]
MDSKFPCWDSLSREYRRWHHEVSSSSSSSSSGNNGAASLSFQAWLVKQRTVANELFWDLKRLAVIKKWSRERFFRNVAELMERKGYYFGCFDVSYYDTIMKGVDVKDAVYPWSVFSSQSDDKLKLKLKPAAEEEEEEEEEEGKITYPHRLAGTPCAACGEDGSTPGWGTPISFTWDGTKASEKYFTCPKPGCTTAWNETLIQCPQCLSDICADCGAIKATATQQFWRQITAALDTSVGDQSPGSAPFRKAAHRKGFMERSLTDVYAPLCVDDFFFNPAAHPHHHHHHHQHHKIKEEDDDDEDTKLISIPGTTLMFRADQSKEEIEEAIEKERDMKQLLELRTNTTGEGDGSRNKEEPRGRQIARIDFAATHEAHPSDRWFSLRNRELYEESSRFCARWFGDVDFPDEYRGSAWLEDYGEQFVQYSNLVAAEDRLVAGWETMMKLGKHRKWLVMGILSQIMEKKIHSELLFGASEEENAELEKQDSMFLAADGYPRTKLRSQMINMFLGNDTVSSHFWLKVDHLTNSTMAILLPLTNLLCYFRPPERWTDTFEMYSQLHSLIAQVGYFAVCMARDPTIFHVLSATPGARMDWGMEAQASYELYRECKDEAERRDHAWTDKRKALLKSARAHARAHAQNVSSTVEADKHIAELERQFRVDRHHRLRGARVKYAVWPMVTRYRPENEGVTLPGSNGSGSGSGSDDGRSSSSSSSSSSSRQLQKYDPRTSDADLEQAEGQRILDIGKCVVIYYQGLMYPRTHADGQGGSRFWSATAPPSSTTATPCGRRPTRSSGPGSAGPGSPSRSRPAPSSWPTACPSTGWRGSTCPGPSRSSGALARGNWQLLAWAITVAGPLALFFRRSRHVLFALVGGLAGVLLVVEAFAWLLAGYSWALSAGSGLAAYFAVLFAYLQGLMGVQF